MKKAQIQMMETIAVILIFIVIVFIGMIFFSRISGSKFEQKLEGFRDLDAIQIAQIASSLPEMQCSQDNILKSNCIDILKLEFGNDIIAAQISDYFDLLEFSTVRVFQVFPDSAGYASLELQELSTGLVLYDNPPPTVGSVLTTFLPISLYDPGGDRYNFGYLEVKVYPR